MENKKKFIAGVATMATLAALAAPGVAMASDGTLTINAGNGSTLAGHTLTAYQLVKYDNATVKNGNVSSFTSSTPDDATAQWVEAALQANGVTYDTSKGETAATALMKLQTNSEKLLKVADKLAATAKTASGVTAKQTVNSTQASEKLTLPEGYYLITDPQGIPILVSTTIQNATSMNGVKLGSTQIKNSTITPDKKVKSNEGQWVDESSAYNGQTKDFKVTFTIPNSLATNTIVLKDAMVGMSYVDGSFNAKADGTDVTSMFSEPAKLTEGSGFTVTGSHELMEQHQGEQLTVTYKAKVTDAAATKDAGNTVSVKQNFNTGITPPTGNPPEDKIFVHTYDLNLKKVAASDTTKALAGAKFTVYNIDAKAYGRYSDTTHQWTFEDQNASDANEFTTDSKGVINFHSLGAGTYTVAETQVPDGYFNTIKPSFTLTITDAGKITVAGKAQPGLTDKIDGADGKTTVQTVTVKNVDSLTQLPQTGAETMGIIIFGAMAIILLAGATGFKAYSIYHEHIDGIAA